MSDLQPVTEKIQTLHKASYESAVADAVKWATVTKKVMYVTYMRARHVFHAFGQEYYTEQNLTYRIDAVVLPSGSVYVPEKGDA